jgi:hypothetical protein
MARATGLLLLAFSIVFASSASAQDRYGQTQQRNFREVGQILTQIEQRTAIFQNTFQQAVDRTGVNESTRREDRINDMVVDFKQALSQLRNDYNRRTGIEPDVQALLERAARIDAFMQRRQLARNAESDWRLLRGDLDRLAGAVNIAWTWERSDNDRPSGVGGLTGTFRLNQAQSDNARSAVQQAVQELPYADRQRISDILMRRLEAPETLSIERRGSTITMASSRAPQMTFDADGQEREEQSPSGNRTIRVMAQLTGDQLLVRTSGDRSSDFEVTFDPMRGGRQMRVTRRLYSERLNQPIVVRSTYDEVSPVANWDIFREAPSRPGDSRPGGSRPGDYAGRGDFIVPDGELITARLNEDLDTNRLASGDRFTMTVTSPRQYEGAVIEGHVGEVNRSGRLSGRAELALNFDSIRTRTGRSGRFEGTLERVVATDGDVLRVDREGSVQDSSQTNRTVGRTAVGSAIGAIIGAVAGGGKGAAIGAVVGGGAGAGTVIAQGRNDLQLRRGSEITVKSSAPNRREVR